MENVDKIEVIIDFLDSNENIEEFINDIVQESLDDFDGEVYDENCNFIYKDVTANFLKSYGDIKALSDEEFELLLNIAIKCVLHKIEAKKNANIRAYEDANYGDFREYYDSSESAYWHLLERYLSDFQYNKSIKEFYYENQDTKIK